jgi:hypothetical protein
VPTDAAAADRCRPVPMPVPLMDRKKRCIPKKALKGKKK